LWGLTDRGEIPCIRIGRAVRYDLCDLHAWLREMKATPGNALRKPEAQRVVGAAASDRELP
jgi:hypothetical protein